MIGVFIGGIVALIVIVGILFLNFSPQFGNVYSKNKRKEFVLFENFKDGKFVNDHPTEMNIDYWKVIKEYIKNDPDRSPEKDITVYKIDSASIEENRKITQLTWFGHSAFLLEIDGKIILLDPMLGSVPAPHPFFGKDRFSKELPIEIEKLPSIDAVIISHDHYDHLDYPSIKKLKNKVQHFFMPLGVGSHLIEWGVPHEKIHEFNWWETFDFDSLQLVCTPARHFSGRALLDRDATLWCSWVINGPDSRIFFSGDSGYDEHFKEIGNKYGPFDIAMMECGQYNEEWKLIHMMPEETVQAAIDVKSKLLLPIHWGAFTLAFHKWTDPVERASKKAKELNMPITTPKIGEAVVIGDGDFPTEKWWLVYD